MKPFTKRFALFTALLFTALICMGIVYIDTTQNFWSVGGGFVRLTISNNVSTITLNTNTPHGFGYNTNDTTRSFHVVGRKPPDDPTDTGVSANPSGNIILNSGAGGDSTNQTDSVGSSTGGTGATGVMLGGAGGNARSSTNNSQGGTGGAFSITGGAGGGTAAVATNSVTGGAGGTLTLSGGVGGSPAFAATNTVGGNGGAFSMAGGVGGTPTAGWARKTGNGGSASLSGGASGNSVRTNSGNAGSVSLVGGNSGNVTTTPGNAGNPGMASVTGGNSGSAAAGGNPAPGAAVNVTGGSGSTGTTNSDGGHVFIVGGIPGSGAVPGNVAIGRTSANAARGGLQVGILTATSATITNLLTAIATLDFPSTAAGTVSDLPIAVAGAADGDVVSLAVPISAVTNCVWMAWASNTVVYVRCSNSQLVTAQDPNSGVFRVLVSKFR